MFRVCLGFAFGFIFMAAAGFSQTNSEKSTQVPSMVQDPPKSKTLDSTLAADSAKAAAKDKRKSKAKAEKAARKADAMAVKDSLRAATSAPALDDSAMAAPTGPSLAADSMQARDSAKAAVTAPASSVSPDSAAPAAEVLSIDSIPRPTVEAAAPASTVTAPETPTRIPPDLRLFNDPALIAKEYGFGILGSVVAGALGFYIGSGIETAIEGESKAHQGTLSFTGIRYDNFYGAFYGGASGMILGSALTTYFVGQTDEEDGGYFMTMLGATAAAGGAFYAAHLMGVNDDIDWKPFIPLLAIPSLGGTLGFNVSRWWNDHKRERAVGKASSLRLHPPLVAWGRDAGGERLEVRALNLTF